MVRFHHKLPKTKIPDIYDFDFEFFFFLVGLEIKAREKKNGMTKGDSEK